MYWQRHAPGEPGLRVNQKRGCDKRGEAAGLADSLSNGTSDQSFMPVTGLFHDMHKDAMAFMEAGIVFILTYVRMAYVNSLMLPSLSAYEWRS